MRLRVPVIVALLLAIVGSASLVATAEAKKPRCNGLRSLCDRPFNEVVLPGTHNAMSSESLGWRLPNQSVAIPEQLEGGIRALLIDTHYGEPRDDGVVETRDDATSAEGDIGMYLCHVFCELGATKLSPVLRQIRKWVRKHPRNVLLIENEDYIRSGDFERAMRRSGLLDHVYRSKAGPALAAASPNDPQARAGRDARRPRGHRRPRLVPADLRGDPPGDALHVPRAGGAHRPRQLGRELRAEPRRQAGVAVPDEPLVAADGAARSPISRPRRRSTRATCWSAERCECADIRGRLPSIIAVDQFTAGGLLGAVRELNRLARLIAA